MSATEYETVAEAVRDLQASYALLSVGYADVQGGMGEGFIRESEADGYTLLERAARLVDMAMCALQPIAKSA